MINYLLDNRFWYYTQNNTALLRVDLRHFSYYILWTNAKEILKNSGNISLKNKSKTYVGNLKWCNRNGNDQQAQTDGKNASALLDFFSSVYTIDNDNDFDNINTRIYDSGNKSTDLNNHISRFITAIVNTIPLYLQVI